MIYLGEQSQARELYSQIIIPWLMIKLQGKKSQTNPTGFDYDGSKSEVCLDNYKRHSNLNNGFKSLLDEGTIRRLITSNPIDLMSIQNDLLHGFEAMGYDEDDFKTEAKKLFVSSGYEDFFYKKLNYRLAEWLDKHTCTYCNRQYVFVMRKPDGKKGMVPQFDHWFSKTDHPLMALSFYNLIPSCSICNSSIKSSAKFSLNDHLHPYVDKEISKLFKFSFIATSPSSYEVSFDVIDSSNPKIKRSLDDLETKLLYKGHSEKELQDLINLRYKYSDNYLDIVLNKTFNGFEVSKAEKYRMIFGVELEDENYHKRPFSKFKNDIINQLLAMS